MLSHSKVKPISECFVRPKYQVEQSKLPHHLSTWDLFQLPRQYMQKGILYSISPTTSSFNIDSFLDKLKHSLSLALVHFYPLAGRLATVKYEEEHTCLVYVDCNKGPGARFIHATAIDVTVSDIIAHTAEMLPTVWSLFGLGETHVLVNHDGHTNPLLSVQVTELIDGVFIGFTMNHSLADGTSLWHFINTLSEIFMSIEIDRAKVSHVPIFKPIHPDGYGPVLKLPFREADHFTRQLDLDLRLRQRIFHFPAASMMRLKAQANAAYCGEGITHKISSFQALSALAWRSITRARNLPLTTETTCSISANARPRFNPPLSQVHFGNAVTLAKATSSVGELLGNGLGLASMLLHQAVMALDENVVQSRLKTRTEALLVANKAGTSVSSTAIFGHNPVVFGGSVGFDMYGPEFGLGRALAIRTGSFAWKDGKITSNPGYEGGGSVDLEVCLLPETMSALELDQEFISFVS